MNSLFYIILYCLVDNKTKKKWKETEINSKFCMLVNKINCTLKIYLKINVGKKRERKNTVVINILD